jgi:hypothetical protein
VGEAALQQLVQLSYPNYLRDLRTDGVIESVLDHHGFGGCFKVVRTIKFTSVEAAASPVPLCTCGLEPGATGHAGACIYLVFGVAEVEVQPGVPRRTIASGTKSVTPSIRGLAAGKAGAGP